MNPITTIKREITIQLPKEKVWALLADFGNVCHGHPKVSKSFITSSNTQGLGATRHCDFTMMGASAEEKIVAWNEGNSMKIEVYELKKMPGIKELSLDLSIKESGKDTILRGELNYSMKNAFFDFMNNLMMKKMNAELIDGIMAGHKKYFETGEIVTEKTKLELNKVVKIS